MIESNISLMLIARRTQCPQERDMEMGYQQRMRTKAGTSFNTTQAGDPKQGQVPDTDAVYAKYWTVIPYLVAGKSMIGTAQACGINVRTLRRWMETPEFKQEYRLAKREHFDLVANRLTAYADEAANTLLDLMRNGDPMMQLRAAKTIIQIAQKSAEIAQRTQTIAELQQMNADKEALIEELETEVAELHDTSETLVQLKSKLSTGNFARPEWFPETNWNKIVQNNRYLDTAA